MVSLYLPFSNISFSNQDEDAFIGDIRKKGDFKRLNHKSLRVIAEIQHNPSLKRSIADKKLKGWDFLRENVRGMSNTITHLCNILRI